MTVLDYEDPADPSVHEPGAAADDGLPEPYATLHHDDGYFTRRRRDDGSSLPFRTDVYTADQMREYASAAVASAIAAEREQTKAESDATRQQMLKLLTGVAAALRGDPPPLTLWSWHDLPDRAAAAVAAIADERSRRFCIAGEKHALLVENHRLKAELSALREQYAEAVRALDYYRAAFRRERPAYVPATIRLLHDVRGDATIGHRSVARAGEHECECNQFGAVSVRAEDGHMLGIKPAEFEPVTWRAA